MTARSENIRYLFQIKSYLRFRVCSVRHLGCFYTVAKNFYTISRIRLCACLSENLGILLRINIVNVLKILTPNSNSALREDYIPKLTNVIHINHRNLAINIYGEITKPSNEGNSVLNFIWGSSIKSYRLMILNKNVHSFEQSSVQEICTISLNYKLHNCVGKTICPLLYVCPYIAHGHIPVFLGVEYMLTWTHYPKE